MNNLEFLQDLLLKKREMVDIEFGKLQELERAVEKQRNIFDKASSDVNTILRSIELLKEKETLAFWEIFLAKRK